MFSLKVIKNATEHELALARVEELFSREVLSEPESNELDVLALLIEQYEQEQFPFESPDPVDAILFRMEQAGLNRKDLVPIIGNKSKVSQVLNRKLSLSLSMIQSLHKELCIPYDVLHREYRTPLIDETASLSSYPVLEMQKRGYLKKYISSAKALKNQISDVSAQYFADPLTQHTAAPALLRASAESVNSQRKVNAEALHAWQTHVLERSQSQNIRTFALKGLTPTWFSELVSLSTKPNALSLAESKLLQTGIHFIIEPHLPKTYLDGAAFLAPCGNPVVGMTMRYKRVDNFWFTLIHELGHVLLHCRKPNDVFFDDHESKSHSQKEHEADSFALNTLIPAGKWCPENLTTAKSVRDFAAKLQIHPDIVAGRLRSEQKNYKLFGPAFRETIINYPA